MIQYIVIKGTQGYDVSELVDKISWSGRKGAAPRTLKASLLDDDGQGHPRVAVDCENGDQCVLYEDGVELFRGIIIEHSQSGKKKLEITACDNMWYLANNSDSFCYTNKRADEIFSDCMARIGMDGGEVVNTGYIIPELPKAKITYYDVLLDALSMTYKATGTRYYIVSQKGDIHLRRRIENALQWVLEVGANVSDYSYSKSISNVRTRVRLLSKEDAIVYETVNSGLEEKIGTLMEVRSIDDTYNQAQLRELVDSVMEQKGTAKKSIKVSGLGISGAISGGCIYVIIPHLGINRTFYIDEDAHEFSGRKHVMSLVLNYADDIDSAG